MSANEELLSYEVDPIRGFLPSEDPLEVLPKQLVVLDEIAYDLPKLITADRVRDTVKALPKLNLKALKTRAQEERAMMILSYLGHAYVWAREGIVHSIPASLAQPWVEVAKRIGRPPILSYASYALHNWRRCDPQGPIELGNIVLLQNFLAGIDEEWFILIHVDIEARAGQIMSRLWHAQRSVEAHDAIAVLDDLKIIVSSLEAMNTTMNRMPERCDPYVYFHRVRPYIHGWKNHPAVPQGILYEGVDEFNGQPQQLRGETGSQSSIVPALDAALSISHKDDPMRPFLLEMQDYMPAKHREFIDVLGKRPSIREFVEKNRSDELVDTYNAALSQIERFRTTHLEYAATYIFKQSQTTANNPSAVGTGGTPFMPYLKKHRDETAEQKL